MHTLTYSHARSTTLDGRRLESDNIRVKPRAFAPPLGAPRVHHALAPHLHTGEKTDYDQGLTTTKGGIRAS